MKATPFDVNTDLAPMPFDPAHCTLAAELKHAGLPWTPHVGCFVWDRDEYITVSSPFPNRIYFILNLGRFLQIFTSRDEIAEKLIWLPTEHQARVLCSRLGMSDAQVAALMALEEHTAARDPLLVLYGLLLDALRVRTKRE
jgi:hypothetical protein